MKLHGLGYVGFTAPDPAAWLEFGTGVLGMMPALMLPGETFGNPSVPGSGPASGGSGVAPDGSVYLKMDDRQWRIGVHPGEAPGLAYLGFPVTDERALTDAIAEAEAAGIAVKRGSDEEAAARGVQNLAWCQDSSGNRIELFHGPTSDFHFTSPHGVEFLTGDLGLGHALLFVSDLDASLDFYRDVLGFKRSDFITFGPGMSANFLRCTERHHSVGLVHVGPLDGIHHLMVEVTSLDALGAALDRATDAGCEITKTLGRHLNDKMVSFYMRGPSGFEVEVGFDGLLVDDATWQDHEATGGEPWGHRGTFKVE
jgi:3,4-dihydroxy-9,10-secoandrosta-1,3,5(10)-triene-9,17-dione 4,5-dioxygenase